MSVKISGKLEDLWSRHHAEWRDTAQVTSQWEEAGRVPPGLLRAKTDGNWWKILADHGLTLFVTREYEHLVMSLSAGAEGKRTSFFRLPHPSGLAADRARGILYVASSRNPNQIFDFRPVRKIALRRDLKGPAPETGSLVPFRSRFYPGSLYLHDLAVLSGKLYGNAVGQNAVIRLLEDGGYRREWWPRCVEVRGRAIESCNHIQLNSIAAGRSLASSFFSASADQVTRLRPGHPDYPVDGRGVIFSGATREVIARGLTRPHSARLHAGRLWVDNSGYGQFGWIEKGRFRPLAHLPGWTRGLAFYENIAFIGVSRVIPRFYRYAPGLDAKKSVCGVFAVDLRNGRTLGRVIWPEGYQIFALEWLPSKMTAGFPFRAGRRLEAREKKLFYAFQH
ncbi:MAG: DUF4915 domain-containing protein [Candidatus Omnitrophica bacterium]|nr:DUF4915 domain-containing protein [Candidatus Omnitrophota bacterium]